MAYCHECGSQVAEIDVFCPYCGITLKPIGVENENDEMTKTIAINSSEVSIPTSSDAASTEPAATADDSTAAESNNIASVENRESAISQDEQKASFSQENLDKQTGDYPQIPTSENLDWKTESVDIPADVYGNQFSEPESLPAQDKSAFEENQVYNEALPSAQKPDEDWGNISTPSDAVQNAPFDENSEPKKIEVIKPLEETPESQENQPVVSEQNTNFEAADTKSAQNEEVFSQPEFILEKSETEITAEQIFPVKNASESSLGFDEPNTLMQPGQDISKEEFAPRFNSLSEQESVQPVEREDYADLASPIEKPAEDLPSLPISAPVFDSVQIVQKDEKNEPFESKENQVIPQLPEQKESRSYTTPNIATGSDTDGKGSSKLKPLEEGTVLNGRYEIVRKIGGGGMGAVYLASDKNLGGVLRAVKEMVQSYIEETQQDKAIADFKRESMLLTSLDHPAIPTIYDYFFDEKEARFYLVMKYISGGDLASRLRSANEGRIDEKIVTEWAIQIADVLDYLHNRQPPIVYRDLKPANIMVDGNTGRVMLIDFGIARWINKEEKGVTAVGTMGYAPPELFSGNVEPRSDIYSLGSTIFHLLTGADPQSNPLLIFDFQKNPHPRQINPQLSDQMERILMSAVEYNAQKRFKSAAEMRQALEEHLQNLKAGKVTFGVKQTPQAVALSEEPVFCGFCGQRIIATDMFCAYCGAKQPIAQQGVHSLGAYKSSSLSAKLMIVGTNDLESPTFALEKDSNLVGRRDPMSNIFPEVDLSKFDPQTKISRRHARIWREGSNYMVEDLGSSNGTILQPAFNNTIRLIPHQPHVLSNGDKLKLGDTTMHFIVG